jgi:hypothetical protein
METGATSEPTADPMAAVLVELRSLKEGLLAILQQRPGLLAAFAVDGLLSCHEADQLYRLTNGTAIGDAKAGLIPSVVRRQRGRDCYYLNVVDARHRWGVRARPEAAR